jgi:hypothetical protein
VVTPSDAAAKPLEMPAAAMISDGWRFFSPARMVGQRLGSKAPASPASVQAPRWPAAVSDVNPHRTASSPRFQTHRQDVVRQNQHLRAMGPSLFVMLPVIAPLVLAGAVLVG